jgi:Stress responsive A/B Barrel Domain
MITHTVLLRLNRPPVDADRADLLQALSDFAADPPCAAGPARVDETLALRGESPRTADVLLEVQFADAGAFGEYIAHERHQRLVTDVLEPLCEGWWSVQSER